MSDYDYDSALDELPECREWSVLIRYMDNHAATLRHALTVAKRLAMEPSQAMANAAIDDHPFQLRDISHLGFRISPQTLFKGAFATMRAQLYREASEGAGE